MTTLVLVLQVGRPSNMPQAKAIIERIMEEATFYNRIYVASIHQDLTEADIRRLMLSKMFFLLFHFPYVSLC